MHMDLIWLKPWQEVAPAPERRQISALADLAEATMRVSMPLALTEAHRLSRSEEE